MLLLRSVELKQIGTPPARYPYTLPFVQAFRRLDFTAPVTVLVGENGSGKSTFLEALAVAAGSITVGSEGVATDRTLDPLRDLARSLKLTWTKRTRRGFFLRAEDFFGYARKLAAVEDEMRGDLEGIDRDYEGRSDTARGLARMPYQRELGAMREAYGEGLDARSHGEAFLALFRQRFLGAGLYLMDEPEAALSPRRQLAFLLLLRSAVEDGGQFVIATHSPVLMAYPGATVLSFDDGHVHETPWESVDHVTLLRDFLNNPSAYLRHLLE